MRPTINVLGDELIGRILAEAQRIMAEVGMEIRGPKLRQRLIDHGLKTTADGSRVLFQGTDGGQVRSHRRRRSRLQPLRLSGRCDRATADKPDRLSNGIAGVWVAGEQVYEGGGVTDARPGRVIKPGK